MIARNLAAQQGLLPRADGEDLLAGAFLRASPRQKESAVCLRQTLALLQSTEDLIRIGAYAAGSNAKLDAALRLEHPLEALLKQAPREASTLEQTEAGMGSLCSALPEDMRGGRQR